MNNIDPSLNEKIANLSPEKQELLKRLVAQKNQVNQIIRHEITRHEGYSFYPASYTQTRFWFLEKLQLGASIYNYARILNFNEYFNINALEKALEQLIFRQEILRTKFVFENGELKQVIVPEFKVNLPLIDLTNYPEENRAQILDNFLTEETKKPFNFEEDLMWRAILFKNNLHEYIFLFVNHHIISDNWSANLLINELLNLYNHLAHEIPLNLPELSIQYGDYAIWQNEQFEKNNFQKQLEYWQNKLAGELPILNLPTDKIRPNIPSYQGKSISFFLPENLTNELKKLASQERVTLFMLFLTAFKVLLYRYTGEEDIIIGSPIFGRQRKETENLIGCFLNTLALRDNLGNNPTFKELLQQVKNTCLEAYANQDVPFEKIIEELQPERNLSNSPVFQVMFNFPENSSTNSLPECASFIEIINRETDISMFDLALSLRHKSKGLEVGFNYSFDILKPETIERMIGHFQILLQGIVNNPLEKISYLPLLTPVEKQQILRDWNNTKADYPKDKCIHQLFEEQVIKTPDNIALVFEEQQLTYQELNEKANQVAHYLRKIGVKSEVLVAICVEKSLEMIIGILGILKAGGCYVPLDPNYPQERLEFMLEDSQISILLTQEKVVNSLQFNCQNILKLDTDWELINQEKTVNLITEVSPQNLAYIIYTSGSTGKPKGVMIEHQSLCNHIIWRQREYKFEENEKFLQRASINFDLSVMEIFLPLINGLQLNICPHDYLSDPNYLVNLIQKSEITTIFITPSLLEILIDKTDINNCSHLKRIFCGGEALSVSLWKKIKNKLELSLIFSNMYGPTETCISNIFWQTNLTL